MVLDLLHRVLPCALAVALALSVSPIATASEPAASSNSSGHCALVTLVSSDADEAQADVYVAKKEPFPTPTSEPISLEGVEPYLQEVITYALGYAALEQPTSGTADVQVELVFPANSDAQTSGYRVSLIVDLSSCSLP